MGNIFGILIVRPLGMLLNIIYDAVQSYGLAIILFALLVKLVILPITYHGKKICCVCRRFRGNSSRSRSSMRKTGSR